MDALGNEVIDGLGDMLDLSIGKRGEQVGQQTEQVGVPDIDSLQYCANSGSKFDKVAEVKHLHF